MSSTITNKTNTLYWFDENGSDWIRAHASLPPSFVESHIPVLLNQRDCATIFGLATHDGIDIGRFLSCANYDTDIDSVSASSIVEMLHILVNSTRNIIVPFLLGRSFDLYNFLVSHSGSPRTKAKYFAEQQIIQIGWLDKDTFSTINDTGDIFLDCSPEHEYFKWTVSEQDRKSTLLALQLS